MTEVQQIDLGKGFLIHLVGLVQISEELKNMTICQEAKSCPGGMKIALQLSTFSFVQVCFVCFHFYQDFWLVVFQDGIVNSLSRLDEG